MQGERSVRMQGMDDRFAAWRNTTAEALLRSPAATTPELRTAVAAGNAPVELMPLIQKIRTSAYTVTNGDVEALKAKFTEDQLFEIIVAAAFGAARERLESALRALEEA